MSNIMGGPAGAGARMGKGPVAFTKKNAKGRSHKTVAPSTGKDDTKGGGDKEVSKAAKRATKGMKPGTGFGETQEPESYMARNSKGQSFKNIASREPKGDSGRQIQTQRKMLDDWACGRRGNYK